jgi:alpha-tubulin suppressor-like RCC1 family protein
VYAWGYNSGGQIGPQGPDINGPSEPIQNSPIKVTGLGSAKTVAAGYGHVCALLQNGEVWCWGGNESGELGDDDLTTNYTATPVKVTGLSGVTAISGQQQTPCALVGSGDVYCWGENDSGELGTNTSGDRSATPIKVAGLGAVSQFSAADHLCAIVGSTVYCWGNNRNSECGQPSTTFEIATPVSIGFGRLGTPQQVGATAGHSCALLSGGSVYCWGWNTYGCLGDPGTEVDASVSQPVQVAGLSGVTQLATDVYDNCAILTTGRVWCWGSRRYGALGDGNDEYDGYSVAPLEVGNVSNAVVVSMYSQHACVLLANGSIKCWGQGAVGQLGNSASSNSAVAVDVTATW